MPETADTDICGAETTGDAPCQNPAGENGRCWIPSHTDPDASNPAGRPSKFTDDRARIALDAARQGLSEAGCGRAAGVSHTTIGRWKEIDPEFETESGERRQFRAAFRRARNAGESTLIENGLYDPDTDSSMAKFLLASSFDYVKSEQHEHTGEGGGGIVIRTTATDEESDGDE